jgi:phage-related protein
VANDRRIKGLTIEIGGDTTQLSESLHDVNKSITSTQAQLKDVEKLLKLDPTNTEMLAQKQELLTQAISKTEEKLETLKDAAVQAEKQLGEGKISQEQFAALQREIAATEIELKRYDSQLDTAADATEDLGDAAEQAAQDSGDASEEIGELSDAADDLGDAAEDAGDGTKDLGESARDSGDGFSVLDGAVATFIGNGLTALVSAIGDAISTFAELSESTQEYRENMSKLYTATSAAGMDADYITQAYSQLYGVLGDETATTTTISNFEKLGVSMQDMDSLLDSATGIWAVYGDSIPLDGLAESVNETAKVGQITGTMADAINWASASNDTWTNALSGNAAALSAFQSGVSQGMSAEDAFNEALAACGDEQERQQLIISTLNGLYADSAETYRENNASIIDAREATVNYQDAVAGVGAAMEPLQTTMTNFKANLISGVSPALQELSDAFMDVVTGADGAEEGIASAVTGLVDTVSSMASDLLPQLLEMGTQILGGIMQGLAQSTPTLMATVSDMILQLIQAITAFLPQFAEAAVTIAGSIVTQLTAFVPQLLQAATTLLMAIVDAVPMIVNTLVPMLPQLITAIVTALLGAVPQLLQAATTLLMAIVNALPTIITALTAALPQILTAITNCLQASIPVLLQAAITLLMAIVDALPTIIDALVAAIPVIITTLVDFFTNNIDTILDAAIQLLMALVDAIPEILVALGNALPQIISAILNAVVDAVPKLLKKSRELFGKIMEALGELLGKLPGKMLEVRDSIVNGIRNSLGSIGSAAADIVSAIWDHIKELPGMMLDVGRDLVEGLWNGISDMVGWIGDKISGFGDSVLGGLKDFFGIASPSKVMRDEVGKFLPAGIAIGIEDSTLSAVKSVRSMADKLRNTAVESLNGMTSGAAYRMQQNPMTAAVRKNAAVVNNYYKTDNSRTVNQTNNSPKALSRLEIYRQTNNALNR